MVMMTGCSNDETVEAVKGNAIGFTSFVDKSTRATDLTNDNLTNFSVYGFMETAAGVVFDNEAVTGKVGDAVWSYVNTQYWTADKTYHFTAIAPTTDADWTFAPLTGAATGQGGVISFTNDGEQDLLYAYNNQTGLTTGNTPVPFTFGHMLSRVKFSFTNVAANDKVSYKVVDVKITDAVKAASLDVAGANKVWTIAADAETAEMDFGAGLATALIARNANDEVAHKYLIPAADRVYTVELTVELYQNGVLANTFTYTVDGGNALAIPAMTMEAGKSYNFHADLNPEDELEPIEFTVTEVEDWADWETAIEI